jgi:hypothetical protein
MIIDDKVRSIIAEWAAANNYVLEIWLFGSRARGDNRPDSDIDLAIVLMPPSGKSDWPAFGAYCASGDEWQQELIARLAWPVSLEAIAPGSDGYG